MSCNTFQARKTRKNTVLTCIADIWRYDFFPLIKPSATIAIVTSSAKTDTKKYSTGKRFDLRECGKIQAEYIFTLKDGRVRVLAFATCIHICLHMCTLTYTEMDFVPKRRHPWSKEVFVIRGPHIQEQSHCSGLRCMITFAPFKFPQVLYVCRENDVLDGDHAPETPGQRNDEK